MDPVRLPGGLKDIVMVEEKPVRELPKGVSVGDIQRLFQELEKERNPLLEMSNFGWQEKGVQRHALKGVCGVVFAHFGAENFRIRVLPKAGLTMDAAVYLWLRARTNRILAWKDDQHSRMLGTDHSKVSVLMARMFGESLCAVVEERIEGAVIQSFRSTRASVSHLRGEPDFGASIRMGFNPMYAPAICSFSALGPDCVENRIIRCAARECRESLQGCDVQLTARLEYVERVVMAGVADVSAGPGLTDGLFENGSNAHYKEALSIALTFLSIDNRCSQTVPLMNLRGFLFDTSKMFEDYIRCILRDAVGLGRLSVRGHDFTSKMRLRLACDDQWLFLGEGERFRSDELSDAHPMEPDFAITKGEKVIALGEIKYQKLRVGQRLGLFQIQSYIHHCEKRWGVIVFFSGPEERRFAQFRVAVGQGSSLKIWVACFLHEADAEISLETLWRRERELIDHFRIKHEYSE